MRYLLLKVTGSPDGTCDGIYYGEDDDLTSIRGPTIFSNACFEPEDCGQFEGYVDLYSDKFQSYTSAVRW